MTETHSSLTFLLAGIAFFMFGMTLASENLQKIMANRVRDLMGQLSDRHFLAILVGALLTLLVQSSGAVTSMLVGLGSAGVVTLPQVMGIIIGTAIGTTFTVQLISFRIAEFGIPIFTLAFAIYFLSRKTIIKDWAGVGMGFGLLFIGIEFMGWGNRVFQNVAFFEEVFAYLSANPLITVAATAGFTGFIHSSAVTLGLAMTLASTGVISAHDSMYWIFGANIGTTSTALMASIGGNYVGRQVAWAHFFYKTLSVVPFFVFATAFVDLVSLLDRSSPRLIANAHTLYNVVAALMFFPFIGFGARWIQKLFPPSKSEREFGVKFLDRQTYQTPEMALSHSRREIARMGDIVYSMVQDSLALFERQDIDLVTSIRERDNRVDLLHREIKLFLVRYADEVHGDNDQIIVYLISFASDLESAADVVDNSLLELATKKHHLKLEFSKSGWEELRRLHELVLKITELSLSCFQLADKKLASKVIFHKRELRDLENQFRETHIERLNRGLKESINTSSIHLDVLSDYRRVASLLTNHAYQHLKNEHLFGFIENKKD